MSSVRYNNVADRKKIVFNYSAFKTSGIDISEESNFLRLQKIKFKNIDYQYH